MTLRVLHVVEAIEGGLARYVADLVCHVRGIDHVVAMPTERSAGITDRDSITRIADAARVHTVGMRRSPVALANVGALRSVRRLVASEHPHIVHGHSAIGGVIARLACGPSPVVYTPNALYPGAAGDLVERALGRRTAAVVAVSPSEGDEIKRRKLAAADRVHVIRTGIAPSAGDAPPFDLRAQIGAPMTAPIVGTAVRLVAQKDPLVFVDAMATVLLRRPDVHAVLFGDGPLRSEVEQRVAACDVADRFHLLGHVPQARLVFPQLDVFVLASRYEGLPYALLEAMQSKVAAVASDAVGNRDVVRHEETGLIVPVGAAGALAAAVEQLLDDDQLRVRLATAAELSVATEFNVRTMAEAYVGLYERLVAASPTR
jgi:glycosyltransferase involved in cell wall biosynthesis